MSTLNELIFLGTGTSVGVPMIGCKCNVCLSDDRKNKRLRSSVFLNINNNRILIDIGPDFRQQMLKFNIDTIDSVLITHEHRDHINGFDDVRAINFIQHKSVDFYLTNNVLDEIKMANQYVFKNLSYPGIPKVNFKIINNTDDFLVGSISITPLQVYHHELSVLGFKINNFAYITDSKTIPQKTIDKIKGIDILVINSLRIKDHIGHNTLEEALEHIKKINPKKAYLTHISHDLGLHKEVQKKLPENVFLAFDGLKLEIK